MEVCIAAGKDGEALAALLECLYKESGVAARVVLMETNAARNGIQNSPEKDDIQAKEIFDILLLDIDNDPLPCAVSARAVVLGTDGSHSKQAMQGLPHGGWIVSYGLNSKSCITASSLQGETLLICLQHAVPCVDGRMAEPMEFSVRRTPRGVAPRLLLAVVSAAICGGVYPDAISAFFANVNEKAFVKQA